MAEIEKDLDELAGEATKISEFHNVNVKPVNWEQLNQRLRCTTTEEHVEDILGTPDGALGTGSIVSLIPSRKKKPVQTKKPDARSDVGSSRMSSGGADNFQFNQTPEFIALPPSRQKALFKGRYFPSFGLICPPLAGTEIFPISPGMEKVHFAVAADMPLDHFDGEPQQQYFDDIKSYMSPIFESYQLSSKDRYLHRFKNMHFNEEWAKKFPYSSHRFQEGNAIRTKVGADEVFKGNLETNSELLVGYRENLTSNALNERHGKGSKLRHEQLQVVESQQAQQKELRQIGFSAGIVKVESSDSMMNADAFGRKFDKFLSVAKTFFAKGHKYIQNHQEVPMLELHNITSYEQFEDWIFQVKDENSVPNATHEKCLQMAPWNEHFSTTQRLKIDGWLGNLLKFDRIKMIKKKVGPLIW